ncbi:MAG TPA: L,D-transpeptidase family protein [Pyrinomonadaceae bacterium]|nr:L,D-transpeptidase family protein [Pyrinomonadaceae bacterium]
MSTMKRKQRVASSLTLILLAGLVFLTATESYGQRQRRSGKATARGLSRAEITQAQARLREMGYGAGRNALVVFQKWERRKVTGRLTRDEFNAIINADAPQPRDPGYKHVEVDVSRQVLLLIDDEGAIQQIIPVSTGSDKPYREKGGSGLAYTPRGRFRVINKIAGWRKSPLGLLYYPSYFSGGVAIHGNPSVPVTPQSHGCVRIPMSVAIDVFKKLPMGTIVLVYDDRGFVSAKDWAAADRREREDEAANRTR